jgi:hypothetical protein
MNVNDGSGLYDRNGMFDQLTVECSELVKAAMCGEYVQFCGLIVDMVQRITALQKGVNNEIQALEARLGEGTEDVQG